MAGTKVTREQFEISNGLRKEVERRVEKGITVRQVVNLMKKASKAAENRLVEEAVDHSLSSSRLIIPFRHLKEIGTSSRRNTRKTPLT